MVVVLLSGSHRMATPVIIGTANGLLYPIKSTQWKELKGARRFSEVILSVDVDGQEVMARCLLDTGCTKSMILKKFTSKKRRTKLSDKDSIKYLTYGSSFMSSMKASVGFKMVEFESQSNNTIEYQFQVDETSNPDNQLYDVIIGNDLLYNMGVNIMFKEKQIQWNDDKVPLKEMGSVHDKEFYEMLHSMYHRKKYRPN